MDDALDRETSLLLARSLPRAETPAHLRARTLASFARPGRYGRFVDRIRRLFDLDEDAAAAYLARIDDPAAWMPSFFAGADIVVVDAGRSCAGAIATFARFAPGLVFPAHAHLGDETTFVLRGSLLDSSGRVVGRGEELFKPEGSLHDFTIGDDDVCIAAALAHGGIDLRDA